MAVNDRRNKQVAMAVRRAEKAPPVGRVLSATLREIPDGVW
ncbi:MAG: hypothetical protein RKP46_09625 [Candidatus Accumulibacter sp.]|nr:hypothetical protein [Accumulibacter sp.]MDS4014601.1 hypothetical protein [Accumulibacter sp.]